MREKIKINDYDQTLTFFWFEKRASLELSMHYPGVYFFSRLIVAQPFRGQGVATKLMNAMMDFLYTKEDFIKIELGINPYGDLTYKQLKKFYEKYGFISNGGEPANEMFELTNESVQKYCIENRIGK